MDNNLFREKSIERVSSPEKLDDYIKVVSPGVWIVLSAIIVLLLGILAWVNVGMVPMTGEDGTVQMVQPIKFLLN